MSMLAICCSVCGKSACITDPYNDDDLDVNRRLVLAMRTIGKDRAGLATFSEIMGMKPPITKPCYNTRNQELLVASKVECQENFNRAAALLCTDVAGDQIDGVEVTCDATWQKHSHQSLFGVVVVASWETGMILDVERSASTATLAPGRGTLTPPLLSSSIGGRVTRQCAA